MSAAAAAIAKRKAQQTVLDYAVRTDMDIRVSKYAPRDELYRMDEAAMTSLHAGGAPMYSLLVHPHMLSELQHDDPVDQLEAILLDLTIAATERLDRLARNL